MTRRLPAEEARPDRTIRSAAVGSPPEPAPDLLTTLGTRLDKRWLRRALFTLAISVYLIEVIRTAWISDDFAITVRSLLNFMNGYEPTFNIDERVDAFTDPLWFLLLSALALNRLNVFWLALALSFACLAALFVVLWRLLARTTEGAVVFSAALILSKAFVDFSTSGLENPLTDLLAVVVCVVSVRAVRGSTRPRDRYLLMGCFGLIYLSRADAVLALAPDVVACLWFSRRAIRRWIAPVLSAWRRSSCGQRSLCSTTEPRSRTPPTRSSATASVTVP